MTGPQATISLAAWPLSSTLILGALPTAPGCARLHARSVLCEWGLGSLAETVELVVSELTTNAVRASTHPDGRLLYEADASLPCVRLRLSSDRMRVLVEVWDSSPLLPKPESAGPSDETGRGLMLVDALCERWDWDVPAGWAGKVVWAVIAGETR